MNRKKWGYPSRLLDCGGSAWNFAILPCCLLAMTQPAWSQVYVRIHFNFVLSATGGRPPTGDINTNAEINAQMEVANEILSNHISELRIENLGITNVSGISGYYTASASDSDRDNLRSDALADKSTYNWRDDALNIYITAGAGSAISKFPSDNDIILVNQNIFDTTVAHEIGEFDKSQAYYSKTSESALQQGVRDKASNKMHKVRRRALEATAEKAEKEADNEEKTP